ncbi:MAG: hypothetical protein KAQ91_01625 [Methylococcales bacterium]|nr:hypothetical protein [Methylococcales bacterium]
MNFFNLKKNKRSLVFSLAFFAYAFTASSTAQATEDWLGFKLPKSVQIHGFLSQGFIHTSDNNLFGHSDDSISTDFRELGLNGSWRVMPELQLALQVVWRDAGQTDEDDLRIDYGLANYSFYSSENTLLGIKGGRVPTPAGLYNDTRDVASTRPNILLPQSIYFDRNRNLGLSADGGYFYAEHRTNYGDFLFNIGVIIPRTDDPSFKRSFIGDRAGVMEGDISWVTHLNYEFQNGLVRLAITYADFNADYQPHTTINNFLPGSLKFKPLIFSAQYNAENWSLTAEYAQRKIHLTDFGLFPNTKTTGESFYIQGAYKFTNYLEGLVRYDQLSIDKNDKNGNKFALQTSTGAPNYSRFAKDWTFGLRLSVIPSLLISAEYHRINGTAWISDLENKELTQHWDLYTMMVSYDF